MSIERCHDCNTQIDTDQDAECYVEIGNMRRLHQEVPLCFDCRERRLDEMGADLPANITSPSFPAGADPEPRTETEGRDHVGMARLGRAVFDAVIMTLHMPTKSVVTPQH